MTDLEDLEAEETLDEFTEDEASEPDLAALIPDNAVAAVCALRRGMFDYRSSPASRIAAARDVLDIALSWVENENRPAPLQPMHWGELLMRYLINEKRVREARKREAALRNSLESTLLEGEKECLPNEENEEPKNQASNRTSAEPATPQETRVLDQQLIMDHACAALIVVRQATFDYCAPPATRRAAERALRAAKARMASIEFQRAWRHRYELLGTFLLQPVPQGNESIARLRGCASKVPGTERIRKERTMSSKSPRASKRISNGQWARGASGNPAGRPVGSRNQSTAFVEQLLLPHQEALVEKTIELALKGDPFALRLCLERLYPVPKERRIDLPLPEVRNAAEATAALSTILTGVGEGQITPGEGAVLAEIVETQQRLVEAGNAEQSRKELEQQGKQMEAELAGKVRGLCGPQRPAPEPPSTAQPEAR